MNSLFVKRPLIKTGIFAILLIPFLILMNEYSPPLSKAPEGYGSSILAFEFSSDEEEVAEVLGPLNAQELHDIDRLGYVDFGFMAIYGMFLFLFMARLEKLSPSALLGKVKWIAPLIVICDALENLQLLNLTKYIADEQVDVSGYIQMLSIFTWLKWGLLALAFAAIGKAMIGMDKSK